MCEDKSFKCVDAIFQLNTDDFEKWKEMFPCVETCKELEDLCKALEVIMDNLEEIFPYPS